MPPGRALKRDTSRFTDAKHREVSRRIEQTSKANRNDPPFSLRVLLDVPVDLKGGKDAMDVAGQQIKAAGQISHSNGWPMLELSQDSADLGDSSGGLHGPEWSVLEAAAQVNDVFE